MQNSQLICQFIVVLFTTKSKTMAVNLRSIQFGGKEYIFLRLVFPETVYLFISMVRSWSQKCVIVHSKRNVPETGKTLDYHILNVSKTEFDATSFTHECEKLSQQARCTRNNYRNSEIRTNLNGGEKKKYQLVTNRSYMYPARWCYDNVLDFSSLCVLLESYSFYQFFMLCLVCPGEYWDSTFK